MTNYLQSHEIPLFREIVRAKYEWFSVSIIHYIGLAILIVQFFRQLLADIRGKTQIYNIYTYWWHIIKDHAQFTYNLVK